MTSTLGSEELLRLKQLEREKRKNETVNPYLDDIRNMQAFNALQTAVWVYDPYSWRNVYANKKALELWNSATVEEFTGRDMTDSSEASDRKARRLCEGWSHAIQTNKPPEPVISDWTYYPNGQPVTCQMVFSPYTLTNERVVLLCEGRPATDETIAANIRRSMEVLRHTSAMVTLYDMTGRVVLTNIRAEYSLLPDLEDKANSLSEDTFLPYISDRSAVKKILDNINKGLPIDLQVDVELQGKQRVHHVYAVRIRDPVSFDKDNSVDRYLILINEHDITEWKLMQDWLNKLQEVDRIKSEFLLTMSHEIRTPMNGVLGMINLLLDSKLSSEQREYAMMVHRSAEGLLSVINDVLDYSKIEARKIELQHQPFSIEQILETATEPLISLACEKGLNLAFIVDHSVPNVLSGDPHRLRQILINLIGNSIKFTVKGEVFVYCRISDEAATPPGPLQHNTPDLSEEDTIYIAFDIIDTGVGLTAAEQQHLFEPFFQAESCAISAQAKHAGTGLGLAIVEQLVHLMNGNITVKSEKGKGSCFKFVLPFSICARPHPELQLSSSVGGSSVDPKGFLSGVGALVVTPHEISHRVLGHHLEWLGADVATVPTPSQALSSVTDSGKKFGLVIFDVISDDLTAVLNHITTSPDMASVLIVIVTSPFQRFQPILEETKHATTGMPLSEQVVFVTQPLSRGKILSAILSAEVKRRNSIDASTLASDVAIVDLADKFSKAITNTNTTNNTNTATTNNTNKVNQSLSLISTSPPQRSLIADKILPSMPRAMPTHTPLPRIAPHTSTLEQRRVLVAEDNVVNQKVVAKHLENMGLAVDIANDGEEAIELVTKKKHDYYAAVLMDLFMPNKTGFEATEAIRAWEKDQGFKEEKDWLPIIALTASVMPDIQIKCRTVGMTDFLSKPWHRQKFIDTISKNCWRDML